MKHLKNRHGIGLTSNLRGPAELAPHRDAKGEKNRRGVLRGGGGLVVRVLGDLYRF